MMYKIRRNANLVKLPTEFTAKNWEYAVKKVQNALAENRDFLLYALGKKMSIKAVAEDMLVEIGKEI